MKRHRFLLLACAGAVIATAASQAPAQAAPVQCNASFHVLHNDRIGSLSVPAGLYQLHGDGVTCAQASSLFATFLTDYDGVLPKPWRYDGENTFTAGTGGGRALRFARQGDAGDDDDGGADYGEFACPGAFRVLHNDRIGRLPVPRGQYRVTLLGANLSCDDADKLFARFLARPDGRLRGGWMVLPGSGEFVRSSTLDGFRVKPIDAGAS